MRYESLAAVDLGSNSFHLQIGRVVGDQIYALDALREPVRLAAGLRADGALDRETQARAIETLARFGERLRGLPPGAVRAVGTNALRVATNASQFIEDAQAALGVPIDVLYGREEARLIYLGVAHSLPASLQRRFVMDIGGGSTEFIIGTGYEPALTESLPMGCVSYSLRYFPGGRIDSIRMKRAMLSASDALQDIASTFVAAGWQEAVASSGTAKAVAGILQAAGWAEGSITASGLDRLRKHLIKAGSVEAAAFPNLRSDRAALLPGGVAVMSAAFEALGLNEMRVSESALRQGVLYDLLGRVQQHDMRESTVEHYMRRYGVDRAQAARVAALAGQLYDSLGEPYDERDKQLLEWAARLHEIGLSIAHAGYHKHSAYVLGNADMPGFSKNEQARLAQIVLAHRGKLAKLADVSAGSLDWPLIFALRIAALFCRSRRDLSVSGLQCRATGQGFQLELPRGWLDAHPLTAAALDAETQEWQTLGLKFAVRESGGRSRSRAA